MNQIDKQIIENTPAPSLRSKLEVHCELIRELRKKRHTYRAIAKLLQEHFGLSVHHSTIHDFVKVRAKPLRSPIEMLNGAEKQLRLPPHRAFVGGSQQITKLSHGNHHSQASIPANHNGITFAEDEFQFDPTKGLTLPDEVLNLKSKPKKD